MAPAAHPSIPEPIARAVEGVIARMARRWPAYAHDLAGAAWVRVLERLPRGQATTPQHAAVVARCGVADFLRYERRQARLVNVAADAFEPDALPARAPASGPDVIALRDAFARLDAADQAALAVGAAYGVAPRRPCAAAPGLTRSAQAWRRHQAALGRARALWGAP